MFAGLFLGAVVLSAPPAPAAPPETSALETRVHSLVRQLRDDSLEERDATERQLLQLGPRALEYVPQPNEQMPAELRQRIARVRQRLELLRAESSADGSTITLDVDKQPLSSVLKSLAKLSGNRIVDLRRQTATEPADPPVSLHVKEVPFWRALDMTLDQAGLTIQPSATDDNNRPLHAVAVVAPLVPRGPRTLRTQYSGAFRIEPLSITAIRGLVDPAENRLQVTLEATWEPRLSPIDAEFPHDSVHAEFDVGPAVKSAQEGTMPMMMRGGSVRFPIPLELPPHGARTIKRLSGHLQVLLPGRVETFRFGELTEGAKLHERKASATVFLDRVHRNDKTWEVAMRVRFDDAAGALQSHRLQWLDENEVWLEGPDGKKIEVGTSEHSGEGEDEYSISYVFPLEGDIKGYAFVYRTPSALMQQKIAFDLKNLELP